MSRDDANAIDSKDNSASEFQDATSGHNEPCDQDKLEVSLHQESSSVTQPVPIRSFDNATWFSKLLFLWPFSYIQFCEKADITESNLPPLRYIFVLD